MEVIAAPTAGPSSVAAPGHEPRTGDAPGPEAAKPACPPYAERMAAGRKATEEKRYRGLIHLGVLEGPVTARIDGTRATLVGKGCSETIEVAAQADAGSSR